MYCPSCGKVIPEGSAFCLNCGKPTSISPPSTMVKEWEYHDFQLTWDKTYWIRCSAYTEPTARLDYWQFYQSVIMEDLQEWLDKGWQPMTEIGPACIQLNTKKTWEGDVGSELFLGAVTFGVSLLFSGSWKYHMTGFYVKLRRPKA